VVQRAESIIIWYSLYMYFSSFFSNGIIKIMSQNEPHNLKNVHPESAGRLMVTSVPVVVPTATLSEIEHLLTKRAKDFETVNYIYIVNSSHTLAGVVSIKDVFQLPRVTKVSDVMKKEVVSVRPRTDQERVAMLAIKYGLKAIPVVDAENHFLGVVPSDTILNVLHQENIEDILRSAGVHTFKDPARDLITASAMVHFKKRIPWLIFGLFGGVTAAVIVGIFKDLLAEMLVLASFIPAIVYISDAVGTQTEMIFIRSLALEHTLNLKPYVRREIKVATSLAIVLSLAISLLSLLWWQSAILGFILGASFFVSIMVAVAVTMFLPWILYRWKFDPALAVGPFATVMTDMLSIIIYFSIASVVLQMFVV